MLHVAFLLLALGGQSAADEAPVFKAEAKDVPAQGDGRPTILIEGTTNLPTGARIELYLIYGRIVDGPVIARDNFTVKDGKFSQEVRPYQKKNFPGKYGLRLMYSPDLQDQRFRGFALGIFEMPFRFGTEADYEREAKVFRSQLAGELQTIVDMGEEVKTQIDKLAGQPESAWAPLRKKWTEKCHEIMMRSDPHRIQEYNALNIDLPATSGLENLTGILGSASKYAAAGRGKEALEGLTVLRQTSLYLIGEINSPKLTSPAQILELLEAAKKLAQEALSRPDQPVLPGRRKFLEMNALLQKSVPEELQPAVLEIGRCAAAFFTALSDKEPNVKELHAELDKSIEKIAGPLRPPK